MEPINENWTNDNGTHAGGVSTGIGFTISWQRGPVDEAGRNGAFLIEVLECCRTQIEYFQDSAYACSENEKALKCLAEAIASLRERRSRREQDGTLGTNKL